MTILTLKENRDVLSVQFRDFLIKRGYKIKTKSGHPSTVYDYIKRIDRIAKRENYDWNEIADKIENIVIKYDCNGTEEEFGNKSHRAYINALKAYKDCLQKR